jgi:hypothetical protein
VVVLVVFVLVKVMVAVDVVFVVTRKQVVEIIQELELDLSRADEDIKVGKALRAKLDQVSQLESENSRLSEEVQYLRF